MAKRIDVRMTQYMRDALRIKMPRSNPRKNNSSIKGNEHAGDDDCRCVGPAHGISDGIAAKEKQERATAEQGNNCEQETGKQIAGAMFVRLKSQLTPAANLQAAQQRPEQQQRRDEQRTMEEFFKIVAGEKCEDLMRGEPLRGPKKGGASNAPISSVAAK